MSTTTPSEALRRIEECRKTENPKLDLSFCGLTKIPIEITDWMELEILDLSSNQISEIENLESLTELTELFLSSNQISEIKNLDELPYLIKLDLSSNKISEIKNLESLVGLTELSLSSNQIREIKNLGELGHLTELSLSSNQIRKIKNLEELISLKKLSLSSNQISEIKNLDSLNSLIILDIQNNNISKIENLEMSTNLMDLMLGRNQIKKIENLEKLTRLRSLSLEKNQISEIKNLHTLVDLKILFLSENHINKIENLKTFSHLEGLFLSRNKITKLNGLPYTLLEKIIYIDLSGNPIEGTTITDWKNPKAILGYLESQHDTLVDNYHLKVNIIGEGRIGKTQLFKYWNKEPYIANLEPTHGTLTTTLSIPKTKYKATIWDFGGQSYHHGFHHVFLRPNDFYLVLWRNDPEKNPDYSYWLGTARNFSHPSKKEYLAPVVLVQNVWTKTDEPQGETTHQADQIIFPDSQKMRRYQATLDDVFVIDIKYLHHNNPHWKVRHEYFESRLYQKMIEHAQSLLPKVPEKWLVVKEELDEHPIKKINLTKKAFHEQYASDFNEFALAGLLDYLEFAGNIIKFPESSSLSKYVFPDPPKLSEWIYNDVLNKRFKNINEGVIDYTKLEELVGKEKAKIFFEIMIEFYLIFPEKDNENNLVIPQFLPENNNNFKRLILKLIPYSFCLRFADFFHESRIFQFISEYGMYADDKTSYWRYGLVFTIDEVNALVYYNVEERVVFVHLENKKGRTIIAQDIFDYFTVIQKKHNESGKRVSYYARRYNVSVSAIIAFLQEHELKVELNPNAKLPLEAESLLAKGFSKQESNHLSMKFVVHTSDFAEYIKPLLLESKRNKINPEELIEGVQLSTNRETYIDIKETLQNNTDDFPVGICVESRKRIKLDNLTLNLLGMINQKLPKVFISYSRKDLEYKDELKTHLSILERYDLLKAWSCEEIQAGTWDSQIQTELEEADVIVYMVSQNFMASGYIMEQEVAKGIKMAQENPDKKIICVLVRNCLWKRWSFMEEKFKDVLDKDGKEIFSKDLSKYQFLPYHQYKNQEGVPIREEIVALEEWGRYPYHVSSVAFTQVADRILTEVTRRN